MHATELEDYIGRKGQLVVREHTGTLRFAVQVLDAKRAYGSLRFLITPMGQAKIPELTAPCYAWVSADRVELEKGKDHADSVAKPTL